jgi:hypothetical protein
MEAWEMPHGDTRREVNRIAARVEAARIAGYRGLIRSLGQEGARRRERPEAHNLAHKRRRGSQSFRQRHLTSKPRALLPGLTTTLAR